MQLPASQVILNELKNAIERQDAYQLAVYTSYLTYLSQAIQPKEFVTKDFFKQCKQFIAEAAACKGAVLFLKSASTAAWMILRIKPEASAYKLTVDYPKVERDPVLEEGIFIDQAGRAAPLLKGVITQVVFVTGINCRMILLQDTQNHVWITATQHTDVLFNCTHQMKGGQKEFDEYCRTIGMYWGANHVRGGPHFVIEQMKQIPILTSIAITGEETADSSLQHPIFKEIAKGWTSTMRSFYPEITINSGYQV